VVRTKIINNLQFISIVTQGQILIIYYNTKTINKSQEDGWARNGVFTSHCG
jgi:hypothetical protein